MKDRCGIVADIAPRQGRVLQVVLAINAAMFLAEFGAGVLAHSTALLADSVDMLGDAIVYGFSLYVVGRGAAWQARGALLKGAVMAAFGVGVLVEVALKIARGRVPGVELMSVVGVLALAANSSVLAFLWRHRSDDINMRSAWLCSRNDVAANGAVVLAAGGVALTGAAWPDIVVGLAMAALFGTSAVEVIRRARRELHTRTASRTSTTTRRRCGRAGTPSARASGWPSSSGRACDWARTPSPTSPKSSKPRASGSSRCRSPTPSPACS